VGRVQARVLGVDRDEELDDLTRVEGVEEDGGDLDGDGLARLAQRGVKVKRFSEVMMTAPGIAGSVPASLHSL